MFQFIVGFALCDAQSLPFWPIGISPAWCLRSFGHDPVVLGFLSLCYDKNFQAHPVHFVPLKRNHSFLEGALALFSGKLYSETIVWAPVGHFSLGILVG